METLATPFTKPSNKLANAVHIYGELAGEKIKKGVFLVLQHANRVPPHIGLMMDNIYHSLSIKGQELNVSGEVLLKNISVRKIPSVFLEIQKHPVFSNDHLGESFAEQVKQFDKVSPDGNTCLSPVKLFFSEFYALDPHKIDLVFDLLEGLKKNNFAGSALGAHLGTLKENIFYLQPYKREDLDKQIAAELAKLKK